MFIFSVRDMRVSRQAAAVLEAVNHVDVNATVSINLLANEVQIAQASASATELSDAIAHAGFDPVLRDCGRTVRGPRQTPPKIPSEGFDHDFSASAELPDERAPGSIAGAARLNSLLPAKALGPLERLSRSPVSTGRFPEGN
jgi:copper chaperone CopZ